MTDDEISRDPPRHKVGDNRAGGTAELSLNLSDPAFEDRSGSGREPGRVRILAVLPAAQQDRESKRDRPVARGVQRSSVKADQIAPGWRRLGFCPGVIPCELVSMLGRAYLDLQ